MRIVSRKAIEKAYIKETVEDTDLTLETVEEKIDKLPKEMFQILGEVVVFIENMNKFEGDQGNENKQ